VHRFHFFIRTRILEKMEQQNITYFTPDDHGQSNGDSRTQFHSNQVAFPSNSSNFYVSNERNFHGSGGRRAAFQSRQQHIVVQQSPTATISLPQKIVQTAPGQQTVHVQLVPQGTPVTSQQHIIISQPIQQSAVAANNETEGGNPVTAFMEYFVEQPQQPGCSSNMPTVYRTTPVSSDNK
jgi:hypothetical protein